MLDRTAGVRPEPDLRRPAASGRLRSHITYIRDCTMSFIGGEGATERKTWLRINLSGRREYGNDKIGR